MNKFDKPHRIQKTVDSKKKLELFDLVSKLDTHEISQFVLNNQISLDITNELGNSLVHEVINIDSRQATEHSKLNVIKFLYSNNADIDKPNKNNQTPLHLACSLQLKLIVDFLIQNDADINYQDNLGSNPLCYLLTGKNTSVDIYDVTEFIPHPKKVDFKLKEETIVLKKLIWRLMQRNDIKRVLPILETIRRTINSIIIEDEEINDIQISTNILITDLASQRELDNNIPRIRDQIFENKNIIRRRINSLFQNFRDLDNLAIHSKTETSWSPLEEHNGSALIRDGKIKKIIKRDIENCKVTVDNLKATFTLMDTVSNMWNENGWQEMVFLHYINVINEKRSLSQNNNPNFQQIGIAPNQYYQYINFIETGSIDEIHQKFKHTLALDNASSIIDFKNLKYVGGPRQIIINYSHPLIVAQPNFNNELGNILQVLNDHEQILYLLSSPLSPGSITVIVAAIDAMLLPQNKLDILMEVGSQNNFNWRDHRQFADWLVRRIQPETIVDLGVDYAYSTFCFAVPQIGHIYGIDSFEGDSFAGIRNTYDYVLEKQKELEFNNITFIKGYFDDVVKTWNKQIDILHIDGLHTYEAVKNDYEKWSPFVKENGIILFHDTMVENPEFGVNRFFNEINLPKTNFKHCNGLGVVSNDVNIINEINKNFEEYIK